MPVTRGALRRFSALAIAALLLAIPAAVSADRPFEFTDRSVGFDCTIQGESTVTFAGAWSAEEWGANAWIQVLDTTIEDPEVDPTILYGFTDDVTVADDGTTVTFDAVIPLFLPGSDPEVPGEPAGEAILSATLVPDGPPQILTSTREGNRQIRQSGWIQPMAVSGTLTMPGDEAVTLGEQCFGQRSDIEVWQTNPRAFVDHRSGIFADCFWETDGGFAAFYAEVGEFGAFADALLLDFEPGAEEPSGGLVADFSAPVSVTFTSSELSATIPMLTYPEGDPAGSAQANATVSPAGPQETFQIIGQGFRSRVKATPLALDGTLVFPTGESFAFADGSCFAVDFRESQKSNPAQGPKPGGKAPVNDDPSGALALGPGSRLNVQTGGAAWEPEVEASCAPIGTTLWYAIEGTGGPITLDTAGSDFDTVAAVYTSDGSAWEEVACVDDVPVGSIGLSFQSAVTWESVAGVTYYVQVGGFDGEFGRLRIAVS